MSESGSFLPPRTEQEREEALILAARLLVKQAKMLGHGVSDEVKETAARHLPEDDYVPLRKPRWWQRILRPDA
jgi:hypothetical protein